MQGYMRRIPGTEDTSQAARDAAWRQLTVPRGSTYVGPGVNPSLYPGAMPTRFGAMGTAAGGWPAGVPASMRVAPPSLYTASSPEQQARWAEASTPEGYAAALQRAQQPGAAPTAAAFPVPPPKPPVPVGVPGGLPGPAPSSPAGAPTAAAFPVPPPKPPVPVGVPGGLPAAPAPAVAPGALGPGTLPQATPTATVPPPPAPSVPAPPIGTPNPSLTSLLASPITPQPRGRGVAPDMVPTIGAPVTSSAVAPSPLSGIGAGTPLPAVGTGLSPTIPGYGQIAPAAPASLAIPGPATALPDQNPAVSGGLIQYLRNLFGGQ